MHCTGSPAGSIMMSLSTDETVMLVVGQVLWSVWIRISSTESTWMIMKDGGAGFAMLDALV